MSESCHEILDPRIRRTRQLLQQALDKLLETKEFDKVSVHDIAEAATVNRATFYDHYHDKFALLKCLVGTRFQELLATRHVDFDGTCSGALRAIILSVCDFLANQRQLQPHMESAVIAVVRGMLLEGFQRHPLPGPVSTELLATTISWAIYGAAKQWLETTDRCSSEEISQTIANLVSPIFPIAVPFQV
jgi:AcrR family transcriptional regulator